MRLGVVIPSYVGNKDNRRATWLFHRAKEFVELLYPETEVSLFFVEGSKVELGPAGDPKRFNARDREIARCRWEGMHDAFRHGVDSILMLDTDIVYPHTFFATMIDFFPQAEAKTCHIRGVDSGRCRHISETFELLPEDTKTQAVAGEVIMLSRSLWDRMEKTVAADRANEDYEIAEKVRAAGAIYYLVPIHIYAE